MPAQHQDPLYCDASDCQNIARHRMMWSEIVEGHDLNLDANLCGLHAAQYESANYVRWVQLRLL